MFASAGMASSSVSYIQVPSGVKFVAKSKFRLKFSRCRFNKIFSDCKPREAGCITKGPTFRELPVVSSVTSTSL